jgi:hypothetical protein
MKIKWFPDFQKRTQDGSVRLDESSWASRPRLPLHTLKKYHQQKSTMFSDSVSEYKQSTANFATWIHNVTQKYLVKKYSKIPNTLNGIKKKVELILSVGLKESFYQSDLWKTMPVALKFGAMAVEKRTEVNNFHVQLAGGNTADQAFVRDNQDHAYCIEVLTFCHQKLKKFYTEKLSLMKTGGNEEQTESNDVDSEEEFAKQQKHNMLMHKTVFSVLEKDFAEADATDEPMDELKLPANANGNLTFDALDLKYGDLRLTLICLVLDLLTATKKITESWQKVRSQKISVQSAVVVTYLAMKQIRSLNTSLQLKYPSYETAHDFFSAIKTAFAKEEYEYLIKLPFFREFNATIVAINSMGTAFSPNKPIDKRSKLIYRTGQLGQPYVEDRAPLEQGGELRFFAVELCELYNIFLALWKKEASDKYKKPDSTETKNKKQDVKKADLEPAEGQGRYASYTNLSLIRIFGEQFDEFFANGKNSLSLSFVGYIWLKIVRVMEDPDVLFMRKTNYLCHKYGRKRRDNLIHSDCILDYMKRIVQPRNKDKEFAIVQVRSNPDTLTFGRRYAPSCNNPYLSGAILLNHTVTDLNVCSLHLQASYSYYRAVCHLYHALRTEGYLKHQIPVLDHFLNLFQSRVFLGDLSSRGDYFKKYQLANHWTAGTVAAVFGHDLTKLPPSGSQVKTRKGLEPEHVSKVYKIIEQETIAHIYEDGMTFSDLLDEVEKITEYEMFGNRYLSTDMLKYFEIFYEFFEECKSSIPQIQTAFQKHYQANYFPNEREEYNYTHSTEYSVTLEAIVTLDLPPERRSEQMLSHLRDIINVLVTFFNEIDMEEEIFIFPPAPQGVYQREFGRIELGKQWYDNLEEKCMENMCFCMDMLEDDIKEDLPREEKAMIYGAIKFKACKCPRLLMQFDPMAELSTILDHAIGGQGKDDDFAEWVFAMGGLVYKETGTKVQCHGGIPPMNDRSKSSLQIAVLNENIFIVNMLLSVIFSPTMLNFQCGIDGNTALHYACEKNNPHMIHALIDKKADAHVLNKQRKYPFDLITDKDLKNQMTMQDKSFEKQIEQKDQDFDGPLRRTFANNMMKSEQRETEMISSLREDLMVNVGASSSSGAVGKKKGKGKNQSLTINEGKQVTAEDEAKAKEAERQLLELLDKEEKDKEGKQNKGKKGKKK